MENIRHEEILKILKKRGKATVKELSDELFVCEMTIRRDLRELERCGLLTRYRGGAAIRIKDVDYPIKIRRRFRESEKKELALAASEYLCDNSCVFLDSSSVCMYPHSAHCQTKKHQTCDKFRPDRTPCGAAAHSVRAGRRQLF